MKQRLYYRIFFFSFMILGIAVFNVNSLAQGDNPLVDQVLQEWLPNVQYEDSEIDVITVDGFDNFNMGVDFAEPHISINPTNPKESFNAFNTNGAWYTHDGHNWTHTFPNFGVSANGDPVTAYDSLGNLYYETMFGGITGCKVMRSSDNGITWGPSLTSVSGNDKNWIAADQTSGPFANYVYTVMTPGNFARTTDFGASWLTTQSFTTQALPGMMVAVGPNVIAGDVSGGVVYVVTNSGSAFASTYTFYASTNGGAAGSFILKSAQNFSNYVGTNVGGRNSVQNMRTRPYPFITADNSYGPFRGRFYLVYASNTPAGNGNKPDIFCRYSTDQGATWSSAVVVNDDANTTLHNQWHPAIWVDKQTGTLFVKWMDTRDTPTSDSAYIYASYSTDGGATFVQNQRISNAKMRINCTTCGGGGTPRYQGDYDAIVSLDNQAIMVWTDFRAGNFGSYTGYFPDFAMLASPNSIIIPQAGGEEFVTVEVPAIKLYTNNAIFSATVSPTPPSGTINLDFPGGNIISSFPGSIQLRIQTSGSVTPGTYTITIQGEGPNGTPVHRRTVQLDVQVPVELTSFTATTKSNDVILNWSTATETNNMGFEIQRKNNAEFEKVGFAQGYGTTTEIQNYSFIDKGIPAGNYSYRLKQIDLDGTTEYSYPVEVTIAPGDYFLSQNYPNPFNPSTNINYSIPVDGNVSLKIYDLLGNEVYTLIDEQKPAGSHEVEFNASSLSSGVYYYQIKSGEFLATKKLMLMK